MKTALGKGLGALLPEKGEEVIYLDIERIFPGEQQPRKTFKDNSLKELAASIKEKGVLQPVIVSRVGDGTFRLVTGGNGAGYGRALGGDTLGIPALGFQDFQECQS